MYSFRDGQAKKKLTNRPSVYAGSILIYALASTDAIRIIRYESEAKACQFAIREYVTDADGTGHYTGIWIPFEFTNDGPSALRNVIQYMLPGIPATTKRDILDGLKDKLYAGRLTGKGRSRMNDENTTTTAGDVDDTPPWDEDCEGLSLTPQEIYNRLSETIIGQDEARKTASALLFGTFGFSTPRRQVVLFSGPTGSGKTEIWRQAKNLIYGGKSNRVVIADAGTMAPEGWCGSNAQHISDVIRDNHLADGNAHLLILDEFDKCCQPCMSSGTDYNKLFQDGLLKLFDGDTVTYGSGDKTVTLDSKMITIVLCGAFSDIYERKAMKKSEKVTRRLIGFLTEPEEPDEPEPEEHEGINPQDLIAYGMRSEIAGRISKIVELEPTNLETMKQIGASIARKLSEEYHVRIAVMEGLMEQLSRQALESGLGARYIRGQIQSRLDDLVFLDPYARSYTIMEPEKEKEKDCFT